MTLYSCSCSANNYIQFVHVYVSCLLPSALARGNINRDLFSGCMYVRTYVRTSSAQARTSRRSLRRRLDVYARARIQYRLGACETRFIAFEPITQDRLAAS